MPQTDPQTIRRGLLDVTGGSAQWRGSQLIVGSSRLVSWTVDATSGIAVPANATEWNSFRSYNKLSIANPNSLWLCQESSGNLADSIGALTLTAASGPTYRNAVAGWSRFGVGMADASVARFVAAAGVGPDPTTTSQTWMFIFSLPTVPAATRCLGGITTSNAVTCCKADWLVSGFPSINVVGVSTDGIVVHSSATYPFMVTYNRTGLVAQTYTNREKVVGTYNAGVIDGNKGMGGSGGVSSGG